MKISQEVQRAYEIAKKTRLNSYSPYSKFKVGAAIKVQGVDQIFGGCNVENSSFGATVCAERTAINAMVAQLGQSKIEFIVVIADTDPMTAPCGICLQTMSEFSELHTPIYLSDLEGIKREGKLSDFLPNPFNKFKVL